MKLKIIYPVIYFNTLEVDVSDDKGEDLLNHSCDDEKAKFVMDVVEKSNPSEVDWIPNGRKGIASAFEAGYSTIKLVES